MGFSFKGLTSAALVNKNATGANAAEKDVVDIPASVAGHTSMDAHRGGDEKLGSPRSYDGSDDDELNKVDTTAEQGVQKVQAMTMVWTKKEIIMAYINVWLLAFILAFTSGSVTLLTPYVTSSFQAHSLTALTGVISSLVAGIWKLPFAKIMNIWGRPLALSIGVVSTVMGLIMMAGCKNVQTYCAAMTFYYMGYNMIDFSITVFVADTSKLRNRGFFVAFVASPWLITSWVSSPAMQRVLAPSGIGFRWAFGILAIVIPLVAAPLIFLFTKNNRKARAQGLLPPEPTRGPPTQTLLYYLQEFDVIGLLILATGLSLFLLAFNIYSYQPHTWTSPLIISFILFGALLIISFGLWEKYAAPVTFIPWVLLKNRTVLFTYTMAGSLYTGWYIWDSYLYSSLVVLFHQPLLHAGYITQTYTMGSCLCSLLYGLALRAYSGKVKRYALVLGVPLTIVGVALMIPFRTPDTNVGYIVMCLVFVAVGGGVLVISEQTTLMAVSEQRDFPALLAMEAMVIAVGSAVGSTIAGAIWTGVFPARLEANLPPDAMADFAAIYGEMDTQAGYPVGSPTRAAIDWSYAQTQRYMLIAGTAVYVVTWVSVALWEDVDVRTMKQRTVGLL